MWEIVEQISQEHGEEAALASIPDSICPACDCLELAPVLGCPNCGFGARRGVIIFGNA